MPGPGGAAYAGIAYEVTTEDQARKAVQELAARKVNLVKIWVDDRNGRAPRLSPESLQGDHRRGPQARPAGQRARVLLHRRRRARERGRRRARASRSRQGDGRRARGVHRAAQRLRPPQSQPRVEHLRGAAPLAAGRRSADDAAAGVDAAAGDRAHEDRRSGTGIRPPSNGRARSTASCSAASRGWRRPTRRSRSAATPASRITCSACPSSTSSKAWPGPA